MRAEPFLTIRDERSAHPHDLASLSASPPPLYPAKEGRSIVHRVFVRLACGASPALGCVGL
eukprot:960329-Prymnesium_polylepis.1